jgi:hypothetical protein
MTIFTGAVVIPVIRNPVVFVWRQYVFSERWPKTQKKIIIIIIIAVKTSNLTTP